MGNTEEEGLSTSFVGSCRKGKDNTQVSEWLTRRLFPELKITDFNRLPSSMPLLMVLPLPWIISSCSFWGISYKASSVTAFSLWSPWLSSSRPPHTIPFLLSYKLVCPSLWHISGSCVCAWLSAVPCDTSSRGYLLNVLKTFTFHICLLICTWLFIT